jgi:hypothetical protein
LGLLPGIHSYADDQCPSGILASPIADLRTAMGSNSSEEETPFDCKVDIDASPETPICIKLVMNDSKLVVASSSKITVWDVDAICAGQVRPNLSLCNEKRT